MGNVKNSMTQEVSSNNNEKNSRENSGQAGLTAKKVFEAIGWSEDTKIWRAKLENRRLIIPVYALNANQIESLKQLGAKWEDNHYDAGNWVINVEDVESVKGIRLVKYIRCQA
jgi:hypothetical protein